MKFRYTLGFILAMTFLFSCQPKQDKTVLPEITTAEKNSFDFDGSTKIEYEENNTFE